MMPRVLEPEVIDTPEASRAYETMDHTAPNAAVVQRLADLGAGGLMLDLGCGPAHIPIGVCERFADARVIGADLSMEMLRLGAARCESTPAGRRVRLVYCDIKRLPIAAGRFDAVYSNTTLHHLPDPAPVLREAWRVLRPGGVLLIRDLYRPPSPHRRDQLVEMYAPPSQNSPLQRRLLSESLGAALTPDELLRAAYEAGIFAPAITIDTDRHMTLQSKGVS